MAYKDKGLADMSRLKRTHTGQGAPADRGGRLDLEFRVLVVALIQSPDIRVMLVRTQLKRAEKPALMSPSESVPVLVRELWYLRSLWPFLDCDTTVWCCRRKLLSEHSPDTYVCLRLCHTFAPSLPRHVTYPPTHPGTHLRLLCIDLVRVGHVWSRHTCDVIARSRFVCDRRAPFAEPGADHGRLSGAPQGFQQNLCRFQCALEIRATHHHCRAGSVAELLPQFLAALGGLRASFWGQPILQAAIARVRHYEPGGVGFALSVSHHEIPVLQRFQWQPPLVCRVPWSILPQACHHPNGADILHQHAHGACTH